VVVEPYNLSGYFIVSSILYIYCDEGKLSLGTRHFSSLFDSSIESILHFLEFILFSFQAKIHFVRLCVSVFLFELFIFGYIKPHNL